MSMKEVKKKFHSLRKGCISCGGPLQTTKEKITRTCLTCAGDALQGFQDMSEGRVKDGFKKVINTSILTGRQNSDSDEVSEAELTKTAHATKVRLAAGLKTKRKSIERKLKRRGLSEDEIKNGLAGFEELDTKD